MKRVLIYLPEELHESLREVAHRARASMSELIRVAIETTYEDELDAIEGEKGLEEYLADPSSAISWEEFKSRMKRGVHA